MAQVPVVHKKDNRIGIVFSILFLLVALFLLFYIKYHEPDPPKVTVPIPITMEESGIEDFEVSNAGGGSPSESENVTPDPQPDPEEQPTQEESDVTTTTGSGDDEAESTSEAETDSNPFTGSGGGGEGDGEGSGFGSDDGPGTGSGDAGKGGSGDRIRENNLKTNPKTPNDQLCYIALKLTVDSRGKVVAASVVRDNTTTTNQQLIDEIITLVKKEVKYKEKPGARNETAYYRIKVSPS
ncbi:MAG: hypothetical protein WEA99_08910 [Brumimicrobium sp.]